MVAIILMCMYPYSAGVGRSGTYITLDTMLQRMPHTDNVNVYEFVHNMRMKRVFMVQTLVSTYIHTVQACVYIIWMCLCVSVSIRVYTYVCMYVCI